MSKEVLSKEVLSKEVPPTSQVTWNEDLARFLLSWR